MTSIDTLKIVLINISFNKIIVFMDHSFKVMY